MYRVVTEGMPAEIIYNNSVQSPRQDRSQDNISARRNQKQTLLTQRLQGHKCQALSLVTTAAN